MMNLIIYIKKFLEDVSINFKRFKNESCLHKISINPSFYVVCFLAIFFNVSEIFLYGFLFVLLHEIAHILVAKVFGLKCKNIIITPIGQIAIIDKIEKLERYKRLMIVSSGVIFNLLMALLFSIYTDEKMQLIKNVNLSIAFFNLLPIYPLDGGRFLQYFLGSKIGDLNAIKIIKKISYILSFILFFVGFLQVILIPYNISILCLSVYFIKINRNEYIRFTFEFYKNLINKKNYEKGKIIMIKEVLVDKDYLNKDIFLYFSGDYYTIINISENGYINWKIDEKIFLEYIHNNGINGTVYDIIKNNF